VEVTAYVSVRAVPPLPVAIVLTRWFRCCRPRPFRQCFVTCPRSPGRKGESRTAGLGTMWQLLHGSALGCADAMAGPDCVLARWFRCCRPRPFPSMLCYMSKIAWTKGRVACSGAWHDVAVAARPPTSGMGTCALPMVSMLQPRVVLVNDILYARVEFVAR
jgi:hypothetical protein